MMLAASPAGHAFGTLTSSTKKLVGFVSSVSATKAS